MKHGVFAAFILSVCANIGFVIARQAQTQQWRAASDEWQAAVADRDTLLETSARDLLDCQSAPTPTPVPRPRVEVSTPTGAPAAPASNADALALDRQETAETLAALDRLIAATKAGVVYGRYLVLMEEVELAIQHTAGTQLRNNEYKAALNESILCVRQAAKLWTACLNDEITTCGKLSWWVKQRYPDFANGAGKPIDTNLSARNYVDRSVGFLFGVAAQRFSDANAM